MHVPDDHPAETGHHFRLALGTERFGLIALRYPFVVLAIFVALGIGAAFGIARLKVDDSLSQLFRSDTPQFRQFERVTRDFPSSEYDVLVVVDGPTLLKRDSIEKLRDLVTDLQLVDGTRGIVSLFSARQPAEGGGVPPPLFPDTLPEGAAYDDLVKTVRDNEIIKGRLLSPEGDLALIVLALDPKTTEGSKLNKVVSEIRKAMTDDLSGSKLRAQLSGVPVMQLEIRTAVERDRLLYNAIGFFAGCAIAIIFFRRVSFMIVAAAPPLVAILLALGALGWLDFRLNMFLNVMTPLIMVISFADSMQLTFAARDRLLAGMSKKDAFRDALLVVGPACVLTHATAGLSFVALLFSQSELIRAFGQAGLLATVIALVSVLLLLPMLGLLLVRSGDTFAAKVASKDTGVQALRSFCAWIVHRMTAHPAIYSAIAVVVVIGLGIVYANLQPRYRLADQVPDKDQAVSASKRLDKELTGANPIDVLVEFPPGASLYDKATLDTLSQVHNTIEQAAGVGNVWSVETLRRWLAEKMGMSDVATLKTYIDVLPKFLTRRFVAEDQKSVLISGRIPDNDASDLAPVVDKLDAALDVARKAHPGYTISVTGLAVIAARNSAEMIGRLNQGLTIEIVFVAAFIGLAFRSPLVMLASIMPGIFPVLAAGALLYFTGQGLQFSSIVALIVSFGLGLSATIHFLNRMRLEEKPGESPEQAVERATVLMGPALILTSIVLACGLAITVFSDLPSLRIFGWLSAFSMIAALTADFLILRPTMTLLRLASEKLRGKPA